MAFICLYLRIHFKNVVSKSYLLKKKKKIKNGYEKKCKMIDYIINFHLLL